MELLANWNRHSKTPRSCTARWEGQVMSVDTKDGVVMEASWAAGIRIFYSGKHVQLLSGVGGDVLFIEKQLCVRGTHAHR